MISGVLESEVSRMAAAIAWGHLADHEFYRACRIAKIKPEGRA